MHPVVFAVPFAVAAIFAIEDGRHTRALAFGLVAALFRPDVAYGVLAAFAVLPGRRRERAIAAGLLLAYVAFATYMEQHLGHADSHWPAYYGHLGESPADALAHPWRLVSALVDPRTVGKALPWMAAGGFLCLASPRLMIPGLAVSLPTLLARWRGTLRWGYHYGLAPTLLLALACVPLIRRRPEQARLVAYGTLVLSLVGGPFATLQLIETEAVPGHVFWQRDDEIHCIVKAIPDGAPVSSVLGVANLIAHRDQIYIWPYPFRGLPPKDVSGRHLHRPDPKLARQVDYIITAGRPGTDLPPGFVEDGATRRLQRFRRVATTQPNASPCPTSSGAATTAANGGR